MQTKDLGIVIPDIKTMIKREQFKSGKITYDAGDVGSRALQLPFEETTKFIDKCVLDARIIYVGRSSIYQPLLFWSENKYYVNFYRCLTSAYNSPVDNDIIFEVTYIE